MKSFDDVFKAYSEWVGAYNRRDKDEGAIRKRYLDLRSKLESEDQIRWPT